MHTLTSSGRQCGGRRFTWLRAVGVATHAVPTHVPRSPPVALHLFRVSTWPQEQGERDALYSLALCHSPSAGGERARGVTRGQNNERIMCRGNSSGRQLSCELGPPAPGRHRVSRRLIGYKNVVYFPMLWLMAHGKLH